jgi:hypothetical protein
LSFQNQNHISAPRTIPSASQLPFPDAGPILRSQLRLDPTAEVSLRSLPDPPPGTKPPQPLPLLIKLAIYGSPRKRLTLQEIYKALEDRFEWFRENKDDKAWKVRLVPVFPDYTIYTTFLFRTQSAITFLSTKSFALFNDQSQNPGKAVIGTSICLKAKATNGFESERIGQRQITPIAKRRKTNHPTKDTRAVLRQMSRELTRISGEGAIKSAKDG